MFLKSRSQFAKERFEFRSFGNFHFLAEFPNSFVDGFDFQGQRLQSLESNCKRIVVAIQEPT